MKEQLEGTTNIIKSCHNVGSVDLDDVSLFCESDDILRSIKLKYNI